MSNTSPQSLFLKTRGRASAFRGHAYSSGVKSSVSIRISPPSLNLPYRKKRLRRLVGKRRLGIVLRERTDEDAATIFREVCKLGLEGIISKRLSAPYRSGPSRDWIKAKNPDSPAMIRAREVEW
jgi:ATP dependent DNA ligase domain